MYLQGLPIAFALTGAKADERETLLDLLASELHLVAARPGQTLIGDKNYFGRDFEHQLAEQDIRLLRPARKGEPERPGTPLFKPLRQVIESLNETFKGQLNHLAPCETSAARSPAGRRTRRPSGPPSTAPVQGKSPSATRANVKDDDSPSAATQRRHIRYATAGTPRVGGVRVARHTQSDTSHPKIDTFGMKTIRNAHQKP